MDKPPPLWRWASELVAVPKVLAAPLRRPHKIESFGEGRPVLVIPGMLSGDKSTALLRGTLREAGFDPHGWGEGFNVRVTAETIARLERRLAAITASSGRKVIVIGWSLGGMYARLLAHRRPELVELVMTLGSPFSGNRRANNAWRLYELLNDHTVDAPPFSEDISVKPPVKTIAMWSSDDGIVSAPCALGRPDESDCQVELPFRHFELGCSRPAIAKVLATLACAMRESC
ncbi:alpha/beta hydrolase [Parerythrobacter aurantius]|uniref:esterase/lipase family protein n=1 Tax=Parerythrobacter aurantius TaxID=3127706 RepID=UPI003253206F